jgi:DNA repair protein RadC
MSNEKANILSSLLNLDNDESVSKIEIPLQESTEYFINVLEELNSTDNKFEKNNIQFQKNIIVKPSSTPKHKGAGHRSRVKEKFRDIESTKIFKDYEIFEMMFFALNPRMDVKNIAKVSAERFKTIKNAIDATKDELKAIFGNSSENIEFVFKLFKEVIHRYNSHDIKSENIDVKQIVTFIRDQIGYSRTEQFLVLFFNSKKQIIQHEIEARGTIDEITVYIRNILKKAISFDAKGILISHNHPSGDATPSFEDIRFTENLQEGCKTIKLQLLDHIIITSDNSFSFVKNKLI